MLDGQLVVIVGKLDDRIKERNKTDELVIGTYIGKLSNKKVIVLLPDGEIFTGEEYEIVKLDEQE